MKNLLLLFGMAFSAVLSQTTVHAQNIFGGEPVQVVGQMNGYNTGSGANSAFRRVSITTGTPTDGRGQWMKTYNAQSSGGDVSNSNMAGGGGNGFLFISGPSSGGNCGGRYNNKWVFSGVGQGALNAINGISSYSNTCGGTDMGLNMSTAGRYTFVFNDCGYTQTNAKFYVGYTANAPVTVTRTGHLFSNGQATISISTSAAPSSGENIYVRFRTGTNDFSTGTSVVQATGSNTSWTATIPSLICNTTYYYYVYTSTRSLSQINSDAESDRSLAVLRYDDNSGNNYSITVNPITASIFNNTGSTQLTCALGAISVTAVGGASYLWTNGLGNAAGATITAPGTYSVTATGANGCTDTKSITITQDISSPNAGITNNTGTTVLGCSVNSISVTATGTGGSLAYAWDGGATPGTAANTFTAPGTYTVTVTNTTTGCFDTEGISITQSPVNTFTGTGNWTDGSKWSCGSAPASGDAFTIDGSATLNTSFTVAGSMSIGNSGTLTVAPNNTLTVSGSANFNNRLVTFKSDATGYGSLGQVTGTISNAGNVTVERYIPNNGFRSWRLLSVPTFGTQTIKAAWQEGQSPLVVGTPGLGTLITGPGGGNGLDGAASAASLLRWNGTGWTGISSTNATLSTFKAYFMYIRGDRTKGITGLTTDANATTLRSNGSIYTGDQNFTVSANAFQLVGNLYPSAIDFTQLGGLSNDNGVTGVARTFYIWDSKKLNGTSLGVYQTFSATNGYDCLISGGSFTLGQPNTTIESGQGFLVQGGTGSGGTLTLKEAAKISGTNGNLGFRPTAVPAKINSRLYTAGNQMADANVVVMDGVYSNAVDGNDAVKLSNPGENFAIQKDNNVLLAVEGRQPVTNNDVIQFRTWNLQQQQYRLEFVMSNFDVNGLTAVLVDRYLNNSTPLIVNGTTEINFSVDANTASAAADRFYVLFRQQSPLPVTFLAVNGIRNTHSVKVDWKVTAERNVSRYEVERSANGSSFTTTGTVIAAGNSSTDLAYSYIDAAAPVAVVFYRVKSIGSNGEVKYSSIVKVGAAGAKAGFNIAPNPVENGVMNLQLINQAEGRYAVRVLATDGKVISSTMINHNGGNSTQLVTLPEVTAGTCQVEITAPDKTRTVQTVMVLSK